MDLRIVGEITRAVTREDIKTPKELPFFISQPQPKLLQQCSPNQSRPNSPKTLTRAWVYSVSHYLSMPFGRAKLN